MIKFQVGQCWEWKHFISKTVSKFKIIDYNSDFQYKILYIDGERIGNTDRISKNFNPIGLKLCESDRVKMILEKYDTPDTN